MISNFPIPIQKQEHVKEVLHDGTLYLGYPVIAGCDGCHFSKPKTCTRPILTDKFFCTPAFNPTHIIWVAEVTA